MTEAASNSVFQKIIPRPDWQDRANCLDADPTLFFPKHGGSTQLAKDICAPCPVRDDCLEYALENNEKFGVWGGKSKREIRRLRRERRQEAAASIVAEVVEVGVPSSLES